MRAFLVACVVLGTPSVATSDVRGPALSADGLRIELPFSHDGLDGGSDTAVFCAVGAAVNEQCTWLRAPYSWLGEGGVIDNTAVEQQIDDTRTAGKFAALPVVALHQLAEVDELAPQRLKRSRVTRRSGELTITVAAANHRKASITVTRGKRILASGRWGCNDDARDQAAITSAVIVGNEPVIYAELSCSGSQEWVRVPSAAASK